MELVRPLLSLCLPTAHPLALARHKDWRKVRAEHLDHYPFCAVCHKSEKVVPHHIKPVHLWPELELDLRNLITLCPDHHLLFGHLMLWASYNPNVRIDCADWREKILARPMRAV